MISSIKSVNELQGHSVNVRANCASIIFLQHLHAASIVNVLQQGLHEYSSPQGAPMATLCSQEGVYRVTKFAVDHTCHAFLYACIQNFLQTLRAKSLCDHSMRAAENRTATIPFCAKSSAKSSGVSRWLLVRSHAVLAYHSCGAHVPISRAPVTLKLIPIPHHVVISCTMSSKVYIPSLVLAKIEMSSIKLMLLN